MGMHKVQFLTGTSHSYIAKTPLLLNFMIRTVHYFLWQLPKHRGVSNR